MNDCWVKADFDFGLNCARLTFAEHEVRSSHGLSVARLLADGPGKAAGPLTDLIEDLRPDLAGCVLVGVACDFAHRHWELLVVHRSLPVQREGEFWPVQRLIKSPPCPECGKAMALCQNPHCGREWCPCRGGTPPACPGCGEAEGYGLESTATPPAGQA